MKRAIFSIMFSLYFISCSSSQYLTGRDYYDISDNLDLEAVAYLFGESENLRDFERGLNDPQLRISNLDLNADGYIDYLRIVDASRRGDYLVIIQAVLGRDFYQDVATISIGRNSMGMPVVEVAGNDYIYGRDYVFIPEYESRPVIFSFFRGPSYHSWNSPYHWGYYPSYYVHRRPWPVHRYHEHIHVHHHYVPHGFHYSGVRKMSPSSYSGRNDYGARRPEHSFINRNQGVQNKEELNRRRPQISDTRQRSMDVRRQSDQPARVPQTNSPSRRSDSGINRGINKTEGNEQTAPSKGRTIRSGESKTPATINREKGPGYEQRGNAEKSGSGRRTGEKTNTSTKRAEPAKTTRRNTASPAVRTESSSRQQATPRSSRANTQEQKSGSESSKSRSGRK